MINIEMPNNTEKTLRIPKKSNVRRVFVETGIQDKKYTNRIYITKDDAEKSRRKVEREILEKIPKAANKTDYSGLIVKRVNEIDGYEDIANFYFAHRDGYIISHRSKTIVLKSAIRLKNIDLTTKKKERKNYSVAQIIAKAFV